LTLEVTAGFMVEHFIGKAQQLGFSLREMKELLLLRGDAAHSCLPVRDASQRVPVAGRVGGSEWQKISRVERY